MTWERERPPRGTGGGKPGHHNRRPAHHSDDPRKVGEPRTLLHELENARRLRDQGAQAAVDAAHTYWRLAAEQAIRDLAREGEPFTAEDLRERVGQLGGHPNAMGGLFITAAKRGEIIPAGYRQATRREAHGRILRAWVGAS